MDLTNQSQKLAGINVPSARQEFLSAQEEIAGQTFRSEGVNREMVARLVTSVEKHHGLTYAGLIQSLTP